MDKIYSRRRINTKKISNYLNKKHNNKKYKNVLYITIIFVIAIITASMTLKAINPIINTQCEVIAKSIATKISNEQATIVMSKYKYEDICSIEKDVNGNITLISANVIPVNEIISDVAVKIQEELNNTNNGKFYIRLGSFTGTKILSGRGPNIEVKMSTVGNVETDLRSEFISSGINQTLHKIYLQVDCNVIVLTPFNNIEQKISNQVLLAEAVIVGITPETYYNFNNVDGNTAMEAMY